MSVTPSPEAVRVAARVRMAEDECSYPITVHPSACVCDVHGTPFEGMEVGDLYGHLSYMGGVCAYVKEQTTAALTAAAPIIQEAAWDAVIARIDLGTPHMVDEKYVAGAVWVRDQITDVLRAATFQEEA